MPSSQSKAAKLLEQVKEARAARHEPTAKMGKIQAEIDTLETSIQKLEGGANAMRDRQAPANRKKSEVEALREVGKATAEDVEAAGKEAAEHVQTLEEIADALEEKKQALSGARARLREAKRKHDRACRDTMENHARQLMQLHVTALASVAAVTRHAEEAFSIAKKENAGGPRAHSLYREASLSDISVSQYLRSMKRSGNGFDVPVLPTE